jgi:adenylate cyclase
MKLRHRLLTYYALLLTVVLGVSLTAVHRVETRRSEEETLSELRTTGHIFDELLAADGRQLATNLNLLVRDFAFREAVATGDPRTILSAAANHRARIGADMLLVLDPEGRVLADTRGASSVRTVVPALKEVAASRGRAGLVKVLALDGVVYQLAAQTINAPDVIGVAAAGFRIDDRMAAALKRLTNSDLLFATNGRIVASTLKGDVREAMSLALKSLHPGEPKILTLARERYLVMAVSSGPDITVYLLRSWDRALEPAAELQALLLAIGLVGLAVMAFLGYLIAERVTASLDQLLRATHSIVEGRYDIKVDIRSRDEIGDLGKAFAQMAQGLAERSKIHSMLQKVVSKDIAQALLTRGDVELKGEEREVTVLFSDFRSFTTISETVPPKELVAQLNSFFTGMSRAIDRHHGVIDKYVGDAVMALFGAPLSTPDDAANAVRAALSMVTEVNAINARRREAGLPIWRQGIGINTGKVVAGTIGAEDRWSYTVIGDAVNIASRLVAVTKTYGSRIVVTDLTRAAAGSAFSYRLLDSIKVRGRSEPVEIYEVVGEGAAPAWVAEFDAALVHFRERRWEEAGKGFRDVLGYVPDDVPSAIYLERIKAELTGPQKAS